MFFKIFSSDYSTHQHCGDETRFEGVQRFDEKRSGRLRQVLRRVWHLSERGRVHRHENEGIVCLFCLVVLIKIMLFATG
jgi:hypothetical protein